MRSTRFLPLRPATPADILALIQDAHRHAGQLDPEADEDAVLTFDSTVAEWRSADDLVSWRPLARSLNQWFETSIPLAEWNAVLVPANARTLRQVCALVATQSQLPNLTPFPIAGTRCESAGRFLILRSLLQRAGLDTSSLSPNTPLSRLLDAHPWAVLAASAKIAPGRLPTAQLVRSSAESRELALQLLLLFGSVGVYFLAAPLYGTLGFLTAILWIRCRPSFGRVRLEGITTMRDLVGRLSAEHAPAV